MSKPNLLTTCACMEAMDRIASKTFLRLSYEYEMCMIRRDLIPTLASICLKSLISNLNSLRDGNDIAAYVNLFDILTLGLVELNFEETEKANNILPDFRLGPKGCEYCNMDYDKYLEHQVPIETYDGRIVNIQEGEFSKVWLDLLYDMTLACSSNMGLEIDDKNILTIFLKLFLEEVFYDLGMNKGKKNYAYKLFDILYFNYKDEDDMWGTDVMPEYKLMVKDDKALEERIEKSIEELENKDNKKDDNYKPLRYN